MKRLEKLSDTELIKLTKDHKQAILENNKLLDNFEQHFDNFKECYFLLEKKVREINEFFYSNFKIELREVGVFSKYNEYAPLRRLNRDDALLHDELYISNISNYSYEIKNLRIEINDNIAIATFYIQHNGIFVNNYNFTGKQIQNRTRSTMIFEKDKAKWFLIHEHSSRLEQ